MKAFMKLLKIILWIVFLLAAVTGGLKYMRPENKDKPQFRTEKLTRGTISALVTATGTLNPVQLITVGSQVSGKVTKMYVKVNDHVKKGQVLAEIDPALLLAQIKQDNSALEIAKANFEQAERDLNRNKMLLQKDFIAKVTFEQAQQTYLQAKNNYDAAKTVIERDTVNLNYATITSPIDGVIIGQTVTEGQTLQSSFQSPDLFKIAGNLTEMKIDVNFPESDITKIKVDMPVIFTVNAFPDRTFSGKVQSVTLSPSNPTGTGGAMNQGGVTYSVIINLKNDDGALLPGMTAYVSVILSQRKDVLRLPLSALRFTPPPEEVSGLQRMFNPMPARPAMPLVDTSDKSKTIYILHNNVLTPLHVTTGESDESFIEVSGDDIAEGDDVVVGIKKANGK